MQTTHLQTAKQPEGQPANERGSTVQIYGRVLSESGWTGKATQMSLLKTLQLIQMLQYGPLTPRILRTRLRIDADVLLHHILEATHMGADIEKLVLGGRIFYCLNNWQACAARVESWIERECARILIDEQLPLF